MLATLFPEQHRPELGREETERAGDAGEAEQQAERLVAVGPVVVDDRLHLGDGRGDGFEHLVDPVEPVGILLVPPIRLAAIGSDAGAEIFHLGQQAADRNADVVELSGHDYFDAL